MRRPLLTGLVALGLLGGSLGASSEATAHGNHHRITKLDLQILTADVPEPISDNSTPKVQHVLASAQTALFDEVLRPRHHER